MGHDGAARAKTGRSCARGVRFTLGEGARGNHQRIQPALAHGPGRAGGQSRQPGVKEREELPIEIQRG